MTVQLRAMERTDLRFVHGLFNDRAVMSYWFEEPFDALAELEDIYERHVHDERERRFIIEYDGQLAGQLNVSSIAYGSLSSATIGYWVSERFAGKGATPTAVALATDHCFYGVGVMVSPYIMSVVINSAVGWRGGYRTASLIQALIGSILLLALPLWKKAHGEESIQAEKKMKVLPISQTLRIPGALMTCLLFLTFCAIEVICGGWSATYMVEAKHMPANLAARATMYFYLGMALGRFLSGVAAKKLTPWQIIFISMGILGVSQTTLLVSGNNVLTMAALLMTGLGVGPLYPNFNYMTPLHFGKDVSQSVMGMQMTFASIGTIAAPALCGVLGQLLGMGIFPAYLMIFYVLTAVGIIALRRTLRQVGRLQQ